MLETKEQKNIFVTTVFLIVVLIAVSIWGKPAYNFNKPTAKQASNTQAEADAYLASVRVDPAASRNLYEKLISEEDVKAQIEQELQINQPIVIPTIDEKKLSINKKTGAGPVTDYFKTSSVLTQGLEGMSADPQQALFDLGEDVNTVSKLGDELNGLIDQYYQMKVPTEALAYHKAQLVSLESYADLVKTSKAYQTDSTVVPWPQLYKDYAIINSQFEVMSKEFSELNNKYAITDSLQKESESYAQGNFFVKPAKALIPVVDIYQKVENILKGVLSTAFASFAVAFYDKLISMIESNYKIANFLYYTDALVSGQYVDDYLDKYVNNTLDKAMIKNFIPELSCGANQNIQSVFKAKADSYLGFDPATLSPTDPDYYTKMAKVGNFLSSPSGWNLYYQDVADQAQAKANQAAQNELLSQGFKVARDQASKGSISASITTLTSTLRNAMQSALNLGVYKSDSIAGKIAYAATQTFLNSFVFKGAVLKEQSVCIASPQIQPVVPAGTVDTGPTPNAPSESDLEKQYDPYNRY